MLIFLVPVDLHPKTIYKITRLVLLYAWFPEIRNTIRLEITSGDRLLNDLLDCCPKCRSDRHHRQMPGMLGTILLTRAISKQGLAKDLLELVNFEDNWSCWLRLFDMGNEKF